MHRSRRLAVHFIKTRPLSCAGRLNEIGLWHSEEPYFRLVGIIWVGAGIPKLEAFNDALASGQHDWSALSAGMDECPHRQGLSCAVSIVDDYVIELYGSIFHTQNDRVITACIWPDLNVIVICKAIYMGHP